jgi:hypothetical protein
MTMQSGRTLKFWDDYHKENEGKEWILQPSVASVSLSVACFGTGFLAQTNKHAGFGTGFLAQMNVPSFSNEMWSVESNENGRQP